LLFPQDLVDHRPPQGVRQRARQSRGGPQQNEAIVKRLGLLQAENGLAMHDENYMPKEVADALKEKGYWNETESDR
jgi:hypothetical protein